MLCGRLTQSEQPDTEMVAKRPTFTAIEESEAFAQLPPLTRDAIVRARTAYSPNVVLKMFRDNNWPLTMGEADALVADRLMQRDYAEHGIGPVTMH